MEATSTSTAAPAPSPAVPEILLDADRLNVLLDIVCTDFITASYASRENARKVVTKALQKLALAVYAATPALATQTLRSVAFRERCRTLVEDVKSEVVQRQQQQQREREREREAMGRSNVSASTTDDDTDTGSDDSLVVRELLKPKLLLFLEETCRERDRQLRGMETTAGSTKMATNVGSNATTASMAATTPSAAPMPSAEGPTWQSAEIRMEGWLRKKGQHVNFWRERYFMIRSTPQGAHFLCYFRKKGDKEPRGWYLLGPGTTVDEVRESPSKIETKPLFTFRIRQTPFATSDDVDEATLANASTASESYQLGAGFTPLVRTPGPSELPLSPEHPLDGDGDARAALKKSSSRKLRHRAAAAGAAAAAATAIVLTGGLAGVGIGVGMVGMSAAAAASAGAGAVIMAQNRQSKGPIALAAESLETANWWRNSIAECIAQAEEQWRRYLNWFREKDHEAQHSQVGTGASESVVLSDEETAQPQASTASIVTGAARVAVTTAPLPLKPAARLRSGSFGTIPRSIAKTFRTSSTFSQETSWRLYEFSSHLRVDIERPLTHSLAKMPPPSLRTSIKVNASARRVYEMLLKPDSSFFTQNHVIQEARVLEDHAKDHSDVVYWKLARAFLWPVYVEARDLCLLRYWREEQDASYFVCFQSTSHPSCPAATSTSVVRASVLGGGFIISPRVQSDERFEECWVTLTIQINPHGWIDTYPARSWYYMHAYGVYFLEMITALSAPADADKTPRPLRLPTAESAAVAPVASSQMIVTETQFEMLPPFRSDLCVRDTLPVKFWSEPSATSFRVRGPHYMSQHTKIPSQPQALRLLSVQVLRSQEGAIRHVGIGSLDAPDRLAMEAPLPFTFIVNFLIPGPPNYAIVLYFTRDEDANENQASNSSCFDDLCQQFFHGSSDEFRTQRLKLIPRVVQGTWSIREGIGATPAILGNKVNHEYYQTSQYLEIDYDISSSPLANSVAKLMLGYARELVIDLAFVIEAQSALELPEQVLGCVRFDCVDMRHATAYAPRSKEVKMS